MNIISCNIYRNKKDFTKLFNFLQNNNADIICLQEVPQFFLERLKRDNPNKYRITQSNKYFTKSKKTKKKLISLYNVILSKYNIDKVKEIPHLQHDKFPIYYRWINKYEKLDIKGLYIDITNPNTQQKYRIFNSYSECVTNSNFRINHFKNLYTHKSISRKNVFIGGYNTISNPLISFSLDLFSSFNSKKYTQIEKNQFKTLFENLNLKNISHKTSITSKLSPLKADFIVVDKNITFKLNTIHNLELITLNNLPIYTELN